MDKKGITDFCKLPRKNFRQVKIESLKTDSFNILDGDYIELFLSLEHKQVNSVVQAMLLNSKENAS